MKNTTPPDDWGTIKDNIEKRRDTTRRVEGTRGRHKRRKRREKSRNGRMKP